MNYYGKESVKIVENTELEEKKVIGVKGLYKSYRNGQLEVEVLNGVDFDVYRGEIVAITGESGCGKSTLLNLLGGLDIPNRGKVLVEGMDINLLSEDELSLFRSKHMGFVFQFHNLLKDFTAQENVMLPYLNVTFNKKEAEYRAKALLKMVGLLSRAQHKPSELSGGEQQRVAIARALINNPDILFADEPTGNLDEKNSEDVHKLLWSLKRKTDITILLVTHNLNRFSDADRMVKLSYGKINEK